MPQGGSALARLWTVRLILLISRSIRPDTKFFIGKKVNVYKSPSKSQENRAKNRVHGGLLLIRIIRWSSFEKLKIQVNLKY